MHLLHHQQEINLKNHMKRSFRPEAPFHAGDGCGTGYSGGRAFKEGQPGYAHILDDDRRINAEKFEEMFYQGHENEYATKNTDDLIMIMNKLQESPEWIELLKGLIK